MQSEMRNKIINGVQWTTLSTVTTAVVQMLRLAILARFLNKVDFGLVAIITFVLGMMEMIGELGFASAIMHKKYLSRSEFSSLYWIQMMVYIVMLGVMSFAAKPVATFYEEPRIAGLLPISLISLLFLGVGKLYDTIFQKEFQFRIIAIRNIVSAILSSIIAVVMAVMGFGVYSLIFSQLAQLAIFNIWNFIIGQRLLRISFHVSFLEVKGLVRIGFFQTGTQIVNYISTQLDVIIIGKLLGMEILGVYNLARDLLSKFISIINSVANKVALPLFSTIQDNVEAMCKNYCKMLQLLTTINFPIIAVIGALSYPITMILYGEKYVDTAHVMMVLTAANLLGVVDNPSGVITTARGRTDMSFICMFLRLAITIPILWVTASLGLNYLLAGKVLISVLLLFLIWYFMMWRVILMPLKMYVTTFFLRFVISIMTYVSCYMFLNVFLHSNNLAVQIIIGGILFVTMYLTLTFLFSRQDVNMMKSLMRQLANKIENNDEG